MSWWYTHWLHKCKKMLQGSLEIFKDLGWDKDVTLPYIQATFFFLLCPRFHEGKGKFLSSPLCLDCWYSSAISPKEKKSVFRKESLLPFCHYCYGLHCTAGVQPTSPCILHRAFSKLSKNSTCWYEGTRWWCWSAILLLFTRLE